jgi:2-phosphoglycerate kinase
VLKSLIVTVRMAASSLSKYKDIFKAIYSSNIVSGTSLLTPSRQLNTRTAQEALSPERIQWVFLGPPGVGKGTYSTRVAVALGVAHIAAGDLVRGEISRRTPVGQQVCPSCESMSGMRQSYILENL